MRIQSKSKFHKFVLSSTLSYYIYLYFIRLNSVSLLRTRSLFLFNCFRFKNSIKKVLYKLRRAKISAKSRRIFAVKHRNYFFSTRRWRRKYKLGIRRIKRKVERRTIARHLKCQFSRHSWGKHFYKRPRYNRYSRNQYFRRAQGRFFSKPIFKPIRVFSKVYKKVYKVNFVAKCFIRNLLSKGFVLRKRMKHIRGLNRLYRMASVLSRLGRKISRGRSRAIFRYLVNRISFFKNLSYLYILGIRIYWFIRKLVVYLNTSLTECSKIINLDVFKSVIYSMEESLRCANVVQNIFVNSLLGRSGIPRSTRDIWYDFADFVPVDRPYVMFAYDPALMLRRIGYIKISERFAKYMKYLMDYLVAVRTFFSLLFKSFRKLRAVMANKINFKLYRNTFFSYFKGFRVNVLSFFPIVFKGCDYIFNSVLRQFDQHKLKRGTYKLKLFTRQLKTVPFIKDILYKLCNEFVPTVLSKRRLLCHNSYHAKKSKYLLRVAHDKYLFRSNLLAKGYITHYIYRFFNTLFMFTCAHHYSIDRHYLYIGDDLFKYNHLLSGGSMVSSTGRVPYTFTTYNNRFLQNNVLDYNLVIRTSRSNCIAVLLVNNKVVYSSSCGKIGFYKTSRSTYFAANQLGLFLCLFLSSVYGLYLRSNKLKSRRLNSRYLLKTYLTKYSRKVIQKRAKVSNRKSRRSVKKRIKVLNRKRRRFVKKRLMVYSNRKFKSSNRLSDCMYRRKPNLSVTYRRRKFSKFMNRKFFISSVLRYSRLSNARLKYFNIHQDRLMKTFCIYYLRRLLVRRFTKRYRYNTSIASVRLNINITGTGVSRLAVRRPIFRFVNMMRRFFVRGHMIRHDNETSDVNYVNLLKFDSRPDSDSSSDDIVSSDVDDTIDLDNVANSNDTSDSGNSSDSSNTNNSGNVNDSSNISNSDTINDSVLYDSKSLSFNSIDSRYNDNSLLDIGLGSLRSHRTAHGKLMRKLKNIFDSSLYGAKRTGQLSVSCSRSIGQIRQIHLLQLVSSRRFRFLYFKYLLLYFRLRRFCVTKLCSVFSNSCTINLFISHARLFTLLIFYICSFTRTKFDCCYVPMHFNVTTPLPYLGIFMCIFRYLHSFVVLGLFFNISCLYPAHMSSLDSSYKFHMACIHLYLYNVYFFIHIMAHLDVRKCPASVLANLICVSYTFFNSSIVINFFLSDTLAVFFDVFYAQLRRFFITIVFYRYAIRAKYDILVSTVLSKFQNLYNCKRTLLNRTKHARDKLVILYNSKTISIPHNGCRSRKLRRK